MIIIIIFLIFSISEIKTTTGYSFLIVFENSFLISLFNLNCSSSNSFKTFFGSFSLESFFDNSGEILLDKIFLILKLLI